MKDSKGEKKDEFRPQSCPDYNINANRRSLKPHEKDLVFTHAPPGQRHVSAGSSPPVCAEWQESLS